MGISLQDQLIQAGLASDKQAKQVNKAKRKDQKQQRKNKGIVVDENRQRAEQALAEKAERDRLKNLKREEQARKKAVTAEITQLIELNRQLKGEGQVPFNFVDNKKVKKFYVSESVHRELAQGKLAIAKLGKRYELVPRTVADKIQERDPSRVILSDSKSQDEEDDYYADYKVPDDLMW